MELRYLLNKPFFCHSALARPRLRSGDEEFMGFPTNKKVELGCLINYIESVQPMLKDTIFIKYFVGVLKIRRPD